MSGISVHVKNSQRINKSMCKKPKIGPREMAYQVKILFTS